MRMLMLVCLALLPAFARAEAGAPKTLPDFRLTSVTVDRTRQVTRRDFEGKVWIADFMFTRCHGSCPLNSLKMETLQKRLPKRVLLASFTVDPKNDQEKALREYARQYHAEPGRWEFLTAPSEDVLLPLYKDSFGTAYRKTDKTACGYETFHSTKFFLMKGAEIRGEYASEDAARMKQLIADAKALAAGARGEGKDSESANNGGAK